MWIPLEPSNKDVFVIHPFKIVGIFLFWPVINEMVIKFSWPKCSFNKSSPLIKIFVGK